MLRRVLALSIAFVISNFLQTEIEDTPTMPPIDAACIAAANTYDAFQSPTLAGSKLISYANPVSNPAPKINDPFNSIPSKTDI
jgi:hypothetical protein